LEHKRLQTGKAILSKKSNAEDIKIPDFKLYYRAIAIKTAWYSHKNRYEDQWDRIQDGDMKPTLILTKAPKTYKGEKIASSTNAAWKSGYPSARN
jgi:hypothetical protein